MPSLLNPIQRITRNLKRDGIFSTIQRIASNKFNRVFRARLCVWVWNHGEPLVNQPANVDVVRYDAASELPHDIHTQLLEKDCETFTSRMKEEFGDHGVLWVALIDGEAAGYQWSRRGNFVRNWHFDLYEADALIFSTVTFHEFRGRGIARAIMATICREEVDEGGRACADCMVWNTPAVRFIQNTGFTKVAERKPLSDHPD